MSWPTHPARRPIIVVSWLRKLATSLRCPVMESWQLFHRYLETIHHLLKWGFVVYLVNLRHPFHSIPSGVCFVSQLERCCYVSFRELILNCSIFEKIDPSRVSFSSRCHVDWSSDVCSSDLREMLLCLIPWVDPELFDPREDRSF